MKTIAKTTVLVGLACMASNSLAAPITYTFEGNGLNIGIFGGLPFNTSNITITLTSDSDAVFLDGSNNPTIIDSNATIDIGGTTGILSFTSTLGLTYDISNDRLLLRNWDANSAMIAMNTDPFALAGYGLDTPIGPVSSTFSNLGGFLNVGTDSGLLTILAMDSLTFTAVPSPAALSLFAITGLVAARRRRN